MADFPVNPPAAGWSLTLPPRLFKELFDHLFQDRDEHGAVVLAEVTEGGRGTRLLARQLIKAVDGVDYVEGTVGYRMLAPHFVRDAVLAARTQGLVYLAAHNHGGRERVGFSRVDMASHERGYPALRRISGNPVGGLVLARAAAAGDLWLTDGSRAELAEVVVPGNNLVRLQPRPPTPPSADDRWDRQARLFGDRGQEALRRLRVGVVGLGGVGSIVVELLARLGVGALVLADDDHVDVTNLPRLLGAGSDDVGEWKVDVAEQNAVRANPTMSVEVYRSSVQEPLAYEAMAACDWIFLAADTNAARFWINKLVQDKLIPGTQLGVKIPVLDGGRIGQIHAVSRQLIPGRGCLWCNGLIDPTELAIDMQPAESRRAARYVPEIPVPSVIALNSLVASEAVNHFMLAVTGLHTSDEVVDIRHRPRSGDREVLTVRRADECDFCTPAH